MGVLLFPAVAVEEGLTHPELATEVANRGAGFGLSDRIDDLLLGELRPLHGSAPFVEDHRSFHITLVFNRRRFLGRRQTLENYGEPGVCLIQKLWFKDTLAKVLVSNPVRLAYVDCELFKGTEEALTGFVPSLVEDGYIFSEDYHLRAVREFLCKLENLERFGKRPMVVTPLCAKLASIRFKCTL